MKNWKRIFLWSAIVAAIIFIAACGKKKEANEMSRTTDQSPGDVSSIQVGKAAPDIEAPATNGENIKLSDLKGSWVVLFFYPKAFTGG